MDNLTTTLSPLVIDLLIAAIILLVAFIKAKIGLFHSVVSIVVIVLAIAVGLVGSKILTEPVANKVWEKYGPKVEEKFDSEVADALEGTTSITESFKESWNRIINTISDEKLESLKIKTDEVDYSDSELVEKLRSVTLIKAKLVVEKFTHLVLFGVITALALLILTLLKNYMEKIANFSVIGWLNRGGGFVLGALEAIVVMIVVFRVAGAINITFFRDLAEGTVLMKWLVGGDIQSAIVQMQNITIEDLKNIKLEDLTTVDLKDVGRQIKELLQNIDLSEAPSRVNDVLESVDVNGVSEEVKGIVDSVDVKGLGDKAKELVTDGVKELVNK